MGAAEKIVQEVVKKMDDNKRTLVLAWAKQAQHISRRDDLSKSGKLRQLKDLNTAPVVRAFLLAVTTSLKQHLWDDRSWPARGALSGLVLGIVTLSGQGAGIAAMGGAIGVPLYVLTASGGAMLGTLITEIEKSRKK